MAKANSKTESVGRFAYDGLDRVIHEKARLGVLTSLVAHPKGLVFGDLKHMCGLTDGNLSRHLQVLQLPLLAIVILFKRLKAQTILVQTLAHFLLQRQLSLTILLLHYRQT